MTNSKPVRIFISYKRNSPDEKVAREVYEALNQIHAVFIDQSVTVGANWATRIEAELHRSDFLIALLSAKSVDSEMVQAELETAFRLQKQFGRPIILPVRLAYLEPYQYPLSAYLNHVSWAFWKGPEDTQRLIEELERGISGGEAPIGEADTNTGLVQINGPRTFQRPLPSAQPMFFEMPEGTMASDSRFYVPRTSDSIAAQAIKRKGVTITIKGPRQMGKSSLLIRTISAARETNKHPVFLDFQLFDTADLIDPNLFFRRFCSSITAELMIEDRVDEYWKKPLSNATLSTMYVSQCLLKESDQTITLAMDEVDIIFNTSFRTNFFGMLRSWHNKRASDPNWNRLDLVLVTSTEPYQLIEDLNQSPFNVGEVLELDDFTAEQVNDLNHRYDSQLDPGDEKRLMNLLNGHPYLVRRALYLIANGRLSAIELFTRATEDRGPFGDHLRNHLFRLHRKKELVVGLRNVISYSTCHDPQVFFALRGAGLIRSEGADVVVPRCQLYADYFRERLNAY
ncbi:MAG: AAA-like domain-containing protein [Acidobacteriota bacterium]